jgi:U3 small nucleolar RNA-associated protein 10
MLSIRLVELHPLFKLNTDIRFQTISSVIPPLVAALRKQKGGPLAGVSELLLSFVAAFEHIPAHRRLDLLYTLMNKLGADDFLFALLAMLVHGHPDNQAVLASAQELAGRYSSLIQLKVPYFADDFEDMY